MLVVVLADEYQEDQFHSRSVSITVEDGGPE